MLLEKFNYPFLLTFDLRFMTGIEFREGSLTLSSKCTQPVKKGMVFSVNIGFSNLTNKTAEDSSGRTYALFLGDTVLAGEEGASGVELTSMSKKKIKSIAIFMGVSEHVQYFTIRRCTVKSGHWVV